jgi:hypothetical protein
MWSRTDNFRQGRAPPDVHLANPRPVFRQQRAGARPAPHERRQRLLDGFSEVVSAMAGMLPRSNELGYSETIFSLTANCPYNFGPVTQVLNEAYE